MARIRREESTTVEVKASKNKTVIGTIVGDFMECKKIGGSDRYASVLFYVEVFDDEIGEYQTLEVFLPNSPVYDNGKYEDSCKVLCQFDWRNEKIVKMTPVTAKRNKK